MVYLAIPPSVALRPYVRSLWYCRAPRMGHRLEHVLPNGCIQIVMNLARNHLTDCGEGGRSSETERSIVVGARGSFETIDTVDLAELAGVVVAPGGFAAIFRERADLFFEQSVGLGSVWPQFDGCDRMAEAREPLNKLRVLDALLCNKVGAKACRRALVEGALSTLGSTGGSVAECARSAGVSERWLSGVFREEVGLSPKLWCRIQRFQSAVRDLHRGGDIPWAELALRCGYYDQSHFINDFRAFSGINPTTYSARRGPWHNHVPLP